MQQGEKYNYARVARDLGVSRAFISEIVHGVKSPTRKVLAHPVFRTLAHNIPHLQELIEFSSTKQMYNDPIIIRGSTLVLMDMQVPYQDGEFVLNVLKVAKAWDIKQGILGGDFFNMNAFSIFFTKPEDSIWHDEAQVAERIAGIMLRYVPKWMMVMGNHDCFLLKKLAHQLDCNDLLKLADMPVGYEASNYFWCLVEDRQGNKWRITHPRNISVIHGRVPQRLASKYQQNIISGHGHLAATSPDDSGNFYCADCGVCCDPERLDYSEERDSTRPRMNRGAVILKEVGGRIYPYHIMPQWADWQALERLYKEDA